MTKKDIPHFNHVDSNIAEEKLINERSLRVLPRFAC